MGSAEEYRISQERAAILDLLRHSAPVIIYQADSLDQFLGELFRMFEPPHQSLIDDVHEDRLARVWQTNPGVLAHEQCLRSEDPILSAFARELDDESELWGHGIRPWEVEEVFWNRPVWAPNKKGRSGDYLMVGRTNGVEV